MTWWAVGAGRRLVFPAAAVQPCRGVFAVPRVLPGAFARISPRALDQPRRIGSALDRRREGPAGSFLGDPSRIGEPEFGETCVGRGLVFFESFFLGGPSSPAPNKPPGRRDTLPLVLFFGSSSWLGRHRCRLFGRCLSPFAVAGCRLLLLNRRHGCRVYRRHGCRLFGRCLSPFAVAGCRLLLLTGDMGVAFSGIDPVAARLVRSMALARPRARASAGYRSGVGRFGPCEALRSRASVARAQAARPASRGSCI